MPTNQFATQKETLFVMYDDVIKTSKFLILKKLMTDEYKENYKEFINYSKIEKLTDSQLMGLIFSATDINILKYLSIKEFDYDATYMDLYLNYENIIKESKPLSFATSMGILLKQKFLDKIFVYTPYYDENIYKDIYDIFGSQKIIYTHGDFSEVIDEIHKTTRITTYVLNDVTLINELIKKGVIAYTNVLVCNTGWQYTINKDNIPVLKLENSDQLSKENIFKLCVFDPDSTSSYNTK